MLRRIAMLALGPIAVAGCQPAASPIRHFPLAMKGLGTEPFWSVELDGRQFAWSAIETPDPRHAVVSRRERNGVLVVAGLLDGQSVRGEFRKAACSDGMSDRAYPFALSLTIGQARFSGCAYPVGMTFTAE